MTVEEWLGKDNQLGVDIWHKKYQHGDESFDEWLDRVSAGDAAVKDLIRNRKFLFGGRVLSNRGVENGANFFNCFSRGFVEDDYLDIMQACVDIGVTFKAQGGQGLSLTKLRPKGTPIGKDFVSDGIMPFMKIYNEVTAGTSQGGCIHEDELVLTKRGYKKIKDIAVGDEVYTKIGYVPVNVVYDKGVQNTYRVTTSKGYEIRTTIDHKFAIDGFHTKHLSELSVGDTVNIITGECACTGIDRMSYVAAHFLANGSFSKGCDCGYITISSEHRDIADTIKLFISEMGYDVRELARDDENAIRIVITADFGRALRNYGVNKTNALNMSVPDAVMFSDDQNVILSFIAGCIDSDGSACEYAIKYSTICENYAKQVHLLMSRVGFFPTILTEHRDYPKHDLYVVSDSIRDNGANFWSIKTTKNHTRFTLNSRYKTPYTMENTGLRPSNAKHLAKIGKTDNIGLFTYLKSTKRPYAPMIFDTIVSVEEIGESHVYDIGLEKEHLFFCNGFYVSNSRKGALMISLDARHKEAESFIKVKSELGAIEQANLSLEVDDEFMDAVDRYYKTGEVVVLHEKRDYSGHQIEYDVTPINIFKMMVDNCYDWGDPALLYVDRFRNYNIMEKVDEYQIETCNPCGKRLPQ